ncbi:dTDP-4-dehydrorhamnose 3,5-epimerase [bioreactor metagenome]|jgi:dTDP-4-dehydrorhamnose 3,5-epimerase|uniref:dTDP-4-dehydrorhamnose 3,5-epimerase n=1 Tax=bioreactor metagenome TaxID=1076179 RepID=A0A645EGL2_9ZZZZ
MSFTIKTNKFPGCYELFPNIRIDSRGTFVKTFHQATFDELHLEIDFAEEYFSVSHKGVLRGMHFQTPPYDHTKLVYCVDGEVLDVLVDLRLGSPTYGEFEVFNLNSIACNMLYIPPGLAHGFYVMSNRAIMMYKVTTLYNPEHDCGILWNSIAIPWPSDRPLISERDNNFQAFDEFRSPFQFEAKRNEK